jgi:replication initiation and membrane attachment protein
MNRTIQTTTAYTVKLAKQPSFYDYGTLLEFYQPIIGPIACSLYMTLFNDIKNNINLEIKNEHSRIFAITQLSKKDFIREIKLLESLSLVKTFYKKKSKDVIFTYELHPPMSHEQLFANDLFMEIMNLKLNKHDLKILTAR